MSPLMRGYMLGIIFPPMAGMSWQSKHKNTPGIEIFFPRGVYVCQVSTHEPRADALYCLLTQTVHSLMVQEKQMSASQPLVLPCISRMRL